MQPCLHTRYAYNLRSFHSARSLRVVFERHRVRGAFGIRSQVRRPPGENRVCSGSIAVGSHEGHENGERGGFMKVGFIGLGNMGSCMAANLINGGHDVTVYNRTSAKMQPLVEQGAQPAACVADACRGDAVITMLADDHAVESVAFGDDGYYRQLGQECDPHFHEHYQCRIIGKAYRGAC